MRFYFDIDDLDGPFRDEVGLDMPDRQAALQEAKSCLSSVLRDVSLQNDSETIASVSVRDPSGVIVAQLTVTLELPEIIAKAE